MVKTPKLLLHQHDLKNFIEDRDKFYQKFFNNLKEEDHDYYMVGRAVDYAIKEHYLHGDDNLYDNKDFENLSDENQTIVLAMVGGYIEKYKDEYFHDINVINYKVNFGKFLIYLSPDLTGLDFENNFWIIEIKTGSDNIPLNFQTMMYAWAKYKYDFKAPKGVIKRVLRKPTIKQTKKETKEGFQERIIKDYVDRPDFYFSATTAETPKVLIKNFEKYLKEICKDMWEAINKKNKYKFYRATNRSWEV